MQYYLHCSANVDFTSALQLLSIISIIVYYWLCIYLSVNNEEIMNRIRRFAVRRTLRSVFDDTKHFVTTKPALYCKKLWGSALAQNYSKWTIIDKNILSSEPEKVMKDYVCSSEFKDIVRQIVFEVIQDSPLNRKTNLEKTTVNLDSFRRNDYFTDP